MALATVAVAAAGLVCGLAAVRATTAAADEPTVILATKTPTTLAGLEAAARQSRTQMARLQAQMAGITRRYDDAAAHLADVNGKLSKTRLALANSRTLLDRQNKLVGDRLAAIYKTGDLTFLDVLATSATLSDLQSQLTFFKRLSQQDQRTNRSLAELNSEVAGLAATLEEQRDEARTAQAAIDEQRLAMADRIAQRKAVLNALVKGIDEILARRAAQTNDLTKPVPLRGSYTPLTWANALLQQLGMPLTRANLTAIVAWELAEGGHWHNTAHYNPLNTTMPEPGATSMNSVGVKAYLSWAQGFTATIATLRNGYYGGILAALRAGDDPYAVAAAVAASPWGTGNFSGLIDR
ncbi:MAG TPA: hypothetical protein VK576_02410 [Thermoleophilia bacterium]|nr:hypothetical protein [Thermoleophilia bacterium]